MKKLATLAFTAALGAALATTAQAAVTQLEGQAGGGIVPWALLSSGTPTVSLTWVGTGDYTLSSSALQFSLFDRVELSYARQTFDTEGVGLGKINVDVFGAKVKVLDMNDDWWRPTVAVGLQYKQTDLDKAILDSWGSDDTGVDFYLAATKVWPLFKKNLLFDLTLRGTKANQIGILGFGSSAHDSYKPELEASVGYFLNENTVLGVEYRAKPDNRPAGLKEDDWYDVFVAYFPSKNLSIVAAYAGLGDIAHEANASDNGQAGKDERGLYLQIQANF